MPHRASDLCYFVEATVSANQELEPDLVALRAIYLDVDERTALNTRDLDLPCREGCDACCHESVFLTPLEFVALWDELQRNLPDLLDEVVERGLEIFRQQRALIEAFEAPMDIETGEERARLLRFTCPLLVDGSCSVYSSRPLYCRLFGNSFNDRSGIYGCDLVGKHLAGRTVRLLPVRGTARQLDDLPLTQKRQVIPYYLHLLG